MPATSSKNDVLHKSLEMPVDSLYIRRLMGQFKTKGPLTRNQSIVTAAHIGVLASLVSWRLLVIAQENHTLEGTQKNSATYTGFHPKARSVFPGSPGSCNATSNRPASMVVWFIFVLIKVIFVFWIAGPTLALDCEPPATGAGGRAESPISGRTLSIGKPKLCAPTIATTVHIPVPRSSVAKDTCAVPPA
jgi:hypothetical protein